MKEDQPMIIRKYALPYGILRCGIMALMLMLGLGSAAQADTLCPDMSKGESSLTAGNMADLQFDIGRLNLCLQRARLLQQIDETVKKREQLRQEPLAAPSMGTGGFAGIPPLAAALPPLPSDSKGLQNSKTTASANSVPVLETKITPQGEWKIQRIWGQGNVMQAQLIKGDVIANIKMGDTLPTGEKVVELSGRGIVLDDGKNRHDLSWKEDTKAGS